MTDRQQLCRSTTPSLGIAHVASSAVTASTAAATASPTAPVVTVPSAGATASVAAHRRGAGRAAVLAGPIGLRGQTHAGQDAKEQQHDQCHQQPGAAAALRGLRWLSDHGFPQRESLPCLTAWHRLPPRQALYPATREASSRSGAAPVGWACSTSAGTLREQHAVTLRNGASPVATISIATTPVAPPGGLVRRNAPSQPLGRRSCPCCPLSSWESPSSDVGRMLPPVEGLAQVAGALRSSSMNALAIIDHLTGEHLRRRP
jgi:hypothetical protein